MDQIVKQKNTLNYFSILGKAWKITWHNKYLWWFGFFMALGGGFNFNFSLNNKDIESIVGSERNIQESFGNFLVQYAGWIIFAMSLVLVLIVVFLVLRIIGQIAIIKSVGDLEKNKKTGFKDGFQSGKKYFWSIFLAGLLIGGFIMGVLIILSLPVAYLFYLSAYPIAFLSLFLAIIIFIPILIIASFVRIYSYIYIVLGKLKIISAIENAYKLFRRNILSSIIISLILAAISMVIGISILILFFLMIVILFPLGIVLYYLLNKVGIMLIVITVFLLFIPIILFIKSIHETYRQTVWVLFFKKIAKSEKEIEDKITNEVIGKKIIEPERT